jgi:hypothetical protein
MAKGEADFVKACTGVHTHLTNTCITDIEIFTRCCLVILRQFLLRPNSGGRGLHSGGDRINSSENDQPADTYEAGGLSVSQGSGQSRDTSEEFSVEMAE